MRPRNSSTSSAATPRRATVSLRVHSNGPKTVLGAPVRFTHAHSSTPVVRGATRDAVVLGLGSGATAPGSHSSAEQATWRDGARPLHPSALLIAEPYSKPLPKRTKQVVRHVAYPGGRARRREQNRAPQLPVASGTGPQRRKCPASLTFLTPQPLTMNQACPPTAAFRTT